MKTLLKIALICLLVKTASAQKRIVDESIRYQQERMVFKQWDRGKFSPTSGLLGLNPYYWLTWGLHPNYPKTDLRPLSPWGPQTQRLALVGAMNTSSNGERLQSDTLQHTALLEIANQSGALSGADPLWVLYYSRELRPVLENTAGSILGPFPLAVRAKLIEQGIYSWYKSQLDGLKERIQAASSADMDRGSRIMAYHRMLGEYQSLQATWASRTISAERNMDKEKMQDEVKAGKIPVSSWTPNRDVQIAKEVLSSRKY